MARPTRPPGPPPLQLELRLEGVDGVVVIEIDAEAEPEIAARIGQIADAGGYAGAEILAKPGWWTVQRPEGPPWPKITPRRVRQSRFERGSVGWSYQQTTDSGDGSFFITRDRADGLDAAYQEIGKVTAGLGFLQGFTPNPIALRRGQVAPRKIIVETISRRAVVTS